jgi:glycine/D-amino acid oxidase-like deaminating enzyme
VARGPGRGSGDRTDEQGRSTDNRAPSFWLQSVGALGATRPAVHGSLDADVCVVGAGYTGLWTAWALLRSQPDLRVVVVEARYTGFGASGRNGGWLSGLLPGSRARLASGPGGRPGVIALQRALIDAVSEVGAIADDEGIDCGYHRGGTLAVAVNQAQHRRLLDGFEADRAWGLGGDDLTVLGPQETADRLKVAGAVASVYSPHCARIQPAQLALGLAAAVERRGGRIFEQSPALGIGPGRVDCPDSTVRAPWVVLATEGYTASLPGRRRRLLPMNSHMIVTAPLPPPAWDAIGWAGAETVMDGGHAYAYLQRTADGRIALGGRGVPYQFGSRAASSATDGSLPVTPETTVQSLEATLRRLFPQVPAPSLRAEQAWSGVLGVARDWCPSVVVEPDGTPGGGGLAWAGGYVGDGVTTSYLAGLTLADLIRGVDGPRVRLPWVGRRAPDWEPEPLRWLGVRSVYAMYRAADRAEAGHPQRTRPSGWARLADRLAGRH